MNNAQLFLLDFIRRTILETIKFWPAEWQDEFRDVLINWLKENL